MMSLTQGEDTMNEQEFCQQCENIGIHLTKKQLDEFRKYKDLLLEWNEKVNLTAITDEGEIWEKHFYDSLVPFAHTHPHHLADIGTGAGFPGIPVKIAWPHVEVDLIEPLGKRCKFLQAVRDELGLEGLNIYNVRAEDHAKDHREKYDTVTSRAVARLSILLELCAPLAKKGGSVIALKGPNGLKELEVSCPEVLGLELAQTAETHMADGDRINFYFEKKKETPLKYPRNFGQIKKHPLEGTACQK